MTGRAAGFDQFLPGSVRQCDIADGLRGVAEMHRQIVDHAHGFRWAQRRAAQPHIVDVPSPSCLAFAYRHDRRQGMALRAGGGDQLPSLALRQRACGLRLCRRARNEVGHSEGAQETTQTPYHHTLLFRSSATE